MLGGTDGATVGAVDGNLVGGAVGDVDGEDVGNTVAANVWCEQSPGADSSSQFDSACVVLNPVLHRLASKSHPQLML